MFLWRFAVAICILSIPHKQPCINTIESIMSHTDVYALTSHPLPLLSRSLLRLTLIAVTWQMRHSTRRDLRRLPDHMLRDIGLDPFVAAHEAAKPFWRA